MVDFLPHSCKIAILALEPWLPLLGAEHRVVVGGLCCRIRLGLVFVVKLVFVIHILDHDSSPVRG